MRVLLRFFVITVAIFSSSLVTSQRAEAFDIYQNISVGMGVPYGIFGVSYELEINIIDSFAISPTVAAGTTILGGGATETGLQLHFGDKEGTRYGISYWSGTNVLIEVDIDELEFETEDGDTAGIHMRFFAGKQKKNIVTLHLLKVITPTEEEMLTKFGAKPEGSDFKIGVGYGFRF
jgi:hypothetical protein